MTNEQLQSVLDYNTAVMVGVQKECEKLEVGFDLLRDVLEAGIQNGTLKAKVETYIKSMLGQ